MEKIYKNYAWEDRNLQMPTIARGRYVQLGEDDRSLNTIQVKLPFWVLDYSFEAAKDYKVEAPISKWQRRTDNTIHLYPANCLYWEKKRLHRIRHSVYILFRHGELAGLNELINPDYNYMEIYDPKQQISRHLIEIAEIGYQTQERGFWRAQTLLFKIISILHSCESQGGPTYTIPSEKTPENLSLSEKVDKYLISHLSKPITRKIIAAKFNVSISSLSHTYKTQTGMSPMKKLMLFRIDLAEDMLLQGESLGVIAEHTGFSSPFHLSSMFKKTIGVSPQEFRRKQKGNKRY